MTSRQILVLGAGRYNVLSIRAAREAGFRTLVADRNPQSPGFAVADHSLSIDLNDCDSLIRAAQDLGGISGVVSMAEVGVRAAANISARLGLPSISEQAAANSTSKAAMRRLWQEIGPYSVDFAVASNLPEAESAARHLDFPLIFKPDRSFGGSRGVTRVEGPDDVLGAFEAARGGGLANSDVVIERYIEGSEHSCEVLIWEGRASVLCTGHKVKSLLPFRVDISVQYPAQLDEEQESFIADMCQRAVSALGITQGSAHVEFGYTMKGPVLFELGARCGGGHTPQIAYHVSGVNEFVEACRMACGMAPSRLSPIYRRGAEYRFLVFAPGIVKRVNVPEAVLNDPHVLDVGVTVRPGDVIHPLQSTSDRAGFLVSVGDALEQVVEYADHGCTQITVEYTDGTVQQASALSQFRELAH